MERLTKPDSDYCHDRCGSVNGCVRLNGDKKRCRDYDLYERLKWYENVWPAMNSISIDCGKLSSEDVCALLDDLRGDEQIQPLKLENQTTNGFDRRNWEGCSYCNDPHPAADCILPGGVEQMLCSKSGLFGDCFIHERHIDYCPMCGKPLNEKAWAEFEKKLEVLTGNE